MADNLASRLSRMSLNTIQLARVRLQPSACVTVLTEQLTGNDEVMPASTEMARLVEESYQAEGLARALRVIWARLEDEVPARPLKLWRSGKKTLIVIEYLLTHGSDATVDALSSGACVAALRKLTHISDNASATPEQREGLRKLRAQASALIELIRDPQELTFRREASAALALRIGSGAAPSLPHGHTSVLRAGGARLSSEEGRSASSSPAKPPTPSAAADVPWGEYVPPPPPLDSAHEAATAATLAELDRSLGVQPPSPTSPPPSPTSPPPIFSVDPFAGLLSDLEQEGHIDTGGVFDSTSGAAGPAAADAPPLCDVCAAAWSLSSAPNPALFTLPPLLGVGPMPPTAQPQLSNVERLLRETAAQREGGVQADPWAAFGAAPASPGTPVAGAQGWAPSWEEPTAKAKGDSLIDL